VPEQLVLYREQAFVERCYCDAPAGARCAMCNRPRCAGHLARGGTCHRCDDAVRLEMEPRTGARWMSGGAASAGVTVAAMIAHLPLIGLPIGLAAGVATYFLHGAALRRSLARRLGPKLAASIGEVTPPRQDEERFPAPGGGGMGRGAPGVPYG
jgi:hypothetical protein